MEICGDNRFEIIAKAKEHLLEATNIDTSEDEMKVLDTFLFRCWQMGWLDRYDRKTEQTEKPKIRKRIDKPFRAVWVDDDHNEIGTPQTEDEILREQCRAFIDIVEQTERSE